MAKKYRKDQKIQWQWSGRLIQGVVVEVFLKPLTKVIKGKTIKRNASAEMPAYLVESEAGNRALKLQSELSVRKPISKKK
jgi:hypothetical protein